ncbi:MAG TPA: 50S ribosomal protein L11 methyltransferase [Gaiellaceae bacterium]|nr:50S ribosomal protein L11 methyltransferase [Gaiellaceae bacterium]
MAGLQPATVLRRAGELEVLVTAAGDVLVATDHGLVSGGPHCLAILDLFGEPTTLGDALETLGHRTGGGQDWIDLSAAVVRLAEAGVLLPGDEAEGGREARSSFDSPGPHVAMLEDRARTSAFLAALDELVRPDDVVVEIGTGTGVLSLGAARAGARHVYAIEATPLAHHARKVAEANGLGDRISVVQGWSTRVSLPERGTLGVAEILGSEALEERALPVLLDARKRLLAPDARLIPSVVRIYGVPVSIPAERVDMLAFTAANTARWSSWYGLELGPLTEYAARLRHRFTVSPEEMREWPALSDPVLLAELDLRALDTPRLELVASGTATASGGANGTVGFFEAELSPGVSISTDPAGEGRPTSWGVPVWLVPEAVELRRGREFSLAYEYTGAAGRIRLVP